MHALYIYVEHAIHVECTLVYILHNCFLSGGPFSSTTKTRGDSRELPLHTAPFWQAFTNSVGARKNDKCVHKKKKRKNHLCNSFPKLGQHEIMCSKETAGADNALCTAKWWFNFKTFARSYLLRCNSITFSKHRHTPCCTTLFGLLALWRF